MRNLDHERRARDSKRIKANYRRGFVSRAMRDQGTDSIPDLWKSHEFSEVLKNWFGRQNPQFRGGEDLPDLENGEVEIARLTLANSVHGEVTNDPAFYLRSIPTIFALNSFTASRMIEGSLRPPLGRTLLRLTATRGYDSRIHWPLRFH
jgi:hypothetical protein